MFNEELVGGTGLEPATSRPPDPYSICMRVLCYMGFKSVENTQSQSSHTFATERWIDEHKKKKKWKVERSD